MNLKFPQAIEEQYLQYNYSSTLIAFRTAFFIGIALYSLFSILDRKVLPDVLHHLNLIRFGIVIPIIGVIIFASFFKGFQKWSQFAAAFASFTAGTGIIVMAVIAPDLGRISYYPGILLVLFFNYILIRHHFIWATVVGWSIFFMYWLSTIIYPDIDSTVIIVNLFFMGGSNIIGMFGAYSLEFYIRKNFYLRLLLQEERLKVESVNTRLEEQVKEKTLSLEKDLEQRIQIENELVSARDKAKESERLKTAFLNNISHEIRTPMNGIVGFLDLMWKTPWDSPQQPVFKEFITQSCERLMTTVDDVVAVSQIESGIVQTNFETFDPLSIIQNALKKIETNAKKKGIEVVFKCDVSELEIKSDEKMFTSIIQKLIHNAVKFTDKGLISVEIKIEDDLIISVKDTGIGIPKHRQKAIFEPFVMADIEDKKAFQGTGLGLFLVLSYTRILKGKLDLESTMDVGTTFCLSLPLD